MPPKAGQTPQLVGLEGIFGKMSIGETMSTGEYHPRPGKGSSGKPIQLLANMYQARFKKTGLTIQHYDMEINPVVKVANQKKPKALLWDIWTQLQVDATGDLKECFQAGAYDSVKNLYSPVMLKMEGGKREITIALKEDGKEPENDKRRFKVVLQHANTIDLDTIIDFCNKNQQTEQTKEIMLVAIQAINVLFRQDASRLCKPVGAQGKRFFGTEGSTPIPDGGLVYSGFMQSFRWTESGQPAMQLDTAYSAFVKPGMLNEVCFGLLGIGAGGGFDSGRGGRGGRGGFDRGGSRGGPRGGSRGGFAGGAPAGGNPGTLDPRQIRKLNEILRNAKFQVTHRKSSRIFTMRSLTTQSAADLKFLLNGTDGKADEMVTIVDYFKKVYNITVKNPRLPCVAYGQRNYIPLEFVKLMPFNSIPMRSLTADQTAAMIKVAAKPPPERAAMIANWRTKLDYENLPKVKAWNIEVNTKMMQLNGRVLQPPNVQYGGNQSQRPAFGGWNLKATKFIKSGKPLTSWSILVLDERYSPQDAQEFVGKLVKVLKASNCPVNNAQPAIIRQRVGSNMEGVRAGLQEAAKSAYMQSKANPQLIIVVMPRKEAPLYSEIKRCAAKDLKLPVVTQCLQGLKIKADARGMDQYLGNVSMKIHAKLGGVTHFVPVGQALDKTTMMIGADVTHPPARGGALPPSIAVTVAGINGNQDLFSPTIRLQEGRVEIIQDLASMLKTHIAIFQKNTGKRPEKIIMFRDGVSEGQYAHCADQEYKQILEAARSLDAKYRPKVTFVVCAKRHNMRFFAANSGDCDRTGNLPPGTVVDSTVTHPFAFDFYLQAHAGLQGTARPTHYIVVKDENGFSADKMQGLCNALSYSYARATRSVSLIPVAYYSDIIAAKCRDWVYKDDDSTIAPSTTSSGPRENMTFDPLELKKRIEDSPEFNSVAWYM